MPPPDLHQIFARCFGPLAVVEGSAVGRINLIGEHTDHQGGWALPIPTPLAVATLAGAAGPPLLKAASREFPDLFILDRVGTSSGGKWGSFLPGVVQVLTEEFGPPTGQGARLLLAGNIPVGSGLSSSAAAILASITVLAQTLWRESGPIPSGRLPTLARRAETLGTGVRCGILDPYSAVHGRSGEALLLDCQKESHRAVPFRPAEEETPLALGVIDSGVHRRLEDGNYERLRGYCAAAARTLGSTLRDLTPGDVERRASELTEDELRHARHVVAENARTLAAAETLQKRDYRRLGELLTESHESLRDLLRATCPETDAIVDHLLSRPGVLGARQVGGGFGGAVIFLAECAVLDRIGETLPSIDPDREPRLILTL